MRTNRLTKPVLDEAETEYCENSLCENEATKTVSVTIRHTGDSESKFCEACYEAYVIGVQHGRISENPKAYSKNDVCLVGSRKSGKLR
jgi:hypothetical protein